MKILSRATAHDGVEPLSEQFVRGLREESGHTHHIVKRNGEVVALLSFDGATAELVTDPAFRRQGLASSLFDEAGRPPVWAHGNLSEARGFAAAQGLEPTRRLLVMTLEGYERSSEGAEALLPAGFRITTAAEECDDEQWLRVNNEAFSWHPEQGGWNLEDLHRARDTKWYDPAGVFFVWDGERLAGFHWTKRVPVVGGGAPGDGSAGESSRLTGEVYVIGVGDEYRGRGLGRALLTAGLDAMADDEAIELYVEGDNDAAINLYEQMGFVVSEEHVVYEDRTS